jgi:tetraacyldisaccharide 4'-kinase
VIVLDDGFQHRRLARELDVVMLDAAEPWGYEHVFPRGMLREPPSGLTRAEVVVLSRADMVDDARRAEIRRRAERLSHGAVWAEVVHAPQRWLAAGAGAAALDELCGQRVAAFCGIGNPRGFRHTLDRCGCEVAALREFPDHHAYTPSDLEQLAAWAAASGATAIVCTHKDLVKIGVDRLGALPLWALVVGIEFLEGQVELEAKLAWLIARLPRCSEP